MIKIMNNVYGKTILESSDKFMNFIIGYLILGCLCSIVFCIICENSEDFKE